MDANPALNVLPVDEPRLREKMTVSSHGLTEYSSLHLDGLGARESKDEEMTWSLLQPDADCAVPELSFDDICPASNMEPSSRRPGVTVFNIGVQPIAYPLPPPSRYVPNASRSRRFTTSIEQAC